MELTLQILQIIATAVGISSVVLAFVTYFRNKFKENRAEAINQISFFRKEIIVTNETFIEEVRNKLGKDYIFSRVRLDDPTIEYTRKNYMKEAQEQVKLLKEVEGCLLKQITILNVLEELSLKIKHFDTYEHEALNSIKIPFVELVENNAIALLFIREIYSGIPTYSTTLEVYERWKDQVDRRDPEERWEEVMDRLSNNK